MMPDYQITCITKPDRANRHEHITHVGNNAGNWKLTREDTIRRIDAGTDTFYTVDKTTGAKVYIAVVREQGKVPFLRTHADGKWNDNLLAQAECIDACKLIA
jgi:hypothetical protein